MADVHPSCNRSHFYNYCSVCLSLDYFKRTFKWGFVFICWCMYHQDLISNIIITIDYSWGFYICACFLWCINFQSSLCLIGIIMSQMNTNYTVILSLIIWCVDLTTIMPLLLPSISRRHQHSFPVNHMNI